MVAVGGAIGSCLRYGIGLLETIFSTKGLGTLIVNVAGCFVIGALYMLSTRYEISSHLRLFLFVGLLGGFTTFSTYALDAITMFHSGEILKAIGYIVFTNIAGLLCFVIGAYIVSILLK